MQIESSALLVEVFPEVGGKIGQIFDKASGYQFLIPPQKDYRTIPVDGDWLQHDTSGMDDCFPNVAAGAYPDYPWTGQLFPDLGEWTHGVWRLTNVGARKVSMERSGNILPYFAVKTVRFIDEQTLEFSYRISNLGKFPIRFLWSAHPLISIDGEYEVELPPAELNLCTFPSDGEVHSWPIWRTTDLSRHWIPYGTSLKIFVTGLSEGWCAVRLPKHTLRFTFDLSSLPALGIWFNNCEFPSWSERRFRCIAMEPCTSPSDLLDELGASAYPTISPGGSVQWSMQLNISPRGLSKAQEPQ